MKISYYRKKRKMTQKELAEKCETTQQQIAKIENGSVDPRLSTIRRMAEALQCEPGDLFWSRKEFAEAVNQTANKHGLFQEKTFYFSKLNALCLKDHKIDIFHPYWEKLIRKDNKIIFKEEK